MATQTGPTAEEKSFDISDISGQTEVWTGSTPLY